MSLKKEQDRINEKAKYEFMQEIGIIPNGKESSKQAGKKDNKDKVSQN